MKNKLLIIFLLLPMVSPAQSWLWAKHLPYEYTHAINADREGHIYITGQTDTALLSGYPPLPNHGSFVTKYNASGEPIWTKTFSGAWPESIAIDSASHIYIVGVYEDSALVWDGHVLVNTTRNTSGLCWSAFVAMLDSSGTCLWIRGDSSSANSEALKVDIDPSGYIYVSGSIQAKAFFGHFTLPYVGNNDNAFIIKYNISGDVVWAISGSGGDGISMAIDKWGHIYQSGYLSDSAISFGSVTCIPPAIPGGNFGGYIARFDTAGHAMWIRARKNSMYFGEWHIATDEAGNVIEVNNYDLPHVIGIDTLTVIPGNCNMELIKYDSSGNLVWTKSAGNIFFISPNNIVTDKWGNIFVGGHIGCNTADSVHFDTISLNCQPAYVPFLVKYDRCAKAVYATVLGNDTTNFSEILNMTSKDSTLYIIGSYTRPGITIGDTTLSAVHGWQDCFLAGWIGTPKYPGCWPLGAPLGTLPPDQMCLFPNPVTTALTITSGEEIHSIIISNLLGQKLYSQTFTSTKIEVDVNGLAPGLYFVRINENMVKRFVRE